MSQSIIALSTNTLHLVDLLRKFVNDAFNFGLSVEQHDSEGMNNSILK